MPDHQLPSLTDDSRVPSISSAGGWEWHGEKVLSDLSDSLKTDVNPQFFDVDAVPDIWARPILFNMAFCDSDHPLHEKIIGEWRGMMALIGLSHWRSHPLSVLNVNLPRPDGGANNGQNNAGDQPSHFARIAGRMAPQKSIDQDTRWTNLHLFRYDSEPIAISSPLTLISTATKYRAHGVAWWSGQVLRDPSGRYGAKDQIKDVLNAQERTALANWIDRLKSRIKQERQEPTKNPLGDASDSWENLLGALREFSDDLSESGLPQGATPAFDIRENEFGMRGDGLLQHLDGVVESPSADLSDSHVRLCPDPDLDTEDLPTLLIIGEEIAEQWGERPQDIIVHGVDTLASVQNVAGPQTSLNQNSIEGGEWRRASDLFSDRMAIIEEQNAFNQSATHSTGKDVGAQITPTLPLKREILQYLKPEDLARRVRITKDHSKQRYRVQLDLPLAGPGSEPRDVTFEEVYESEDVVIKSESPYFEVWPDFVADDWSEYYTFYSGLGNFYFVAYPEPSSGNTSTEHLRHGEVQRAIARMKQFPTAALCYDANGDEYLGFVATEPPAQASAPHSDKQTVGVDFGTSNTTVYVSEADGAPEPIQFKDRLVPITSEKSLRLTNTRNFFIPARDQGVPFLTFFHHLPTASDANPGPTVDVLKEGHILYVDHVGDRQRLDSGEVHHDLKWSKSSADRARTQAFLEQIVLQARAEAAARRASKIEWRYSFPTSFSKGQKESIEETWKRLVDPKKLKAKSESLSTATYFLDAQNARLTDGSICIDIGGASADVAVWQNGDLLLQTSILLASQEILLKTIAAEAGAYQSVFKSKDYDGIVENKGSVQDTITDLEELLVLQGDEFLENLHVLSGEGPILRLRQRIALGVCGIFYYAGLLIRHLVNQGMFDPTEEGLPDVYFGGNGSKLLHWMAQGTFRSGDSLASGLFKKVLMEASDIRSQSTEMPFTVHLTPDDRVKHEVAYGLVSDRNLSVSGESPVIAGEAFSEGRTSDKSGTWESPLTAELLSNGIDMEGGLNHVHRLIDTINEFADDNRELFDPLPVQESKFREARGRIRDHLQDLSGKDEQDIDVEPLFVLGVKEYLDILRADN